MYQWITAVLGTTLFQQQQQMCAARVHFASVGCLHLSESVPTYVLLCVRVCVSVCMYVCMYVCI